MHLSSGSLFRSIPSMVRQEAEKFFGTLPAGMFIIHILSHSARRPIFGLGIIEDLARHGYKLRPGTLYPVLYEPGPKGYLCSAEKRDGRQMRRLYRAMPAGRKALEAAKGKVRELFAELFEDA